MTGKKKNLPGMDPLEGFDPAKVKSTAQIVIPRDPLKRVIGQDEAVQLSLIAANQRRHLLLVGPPGTGKSMIAQAISFHLPRPSQEIQVVHNPEYPERPFIVVKEEKEILEEKAHSVSAMGEIISSVDAPDTISEKLGFRCPKCGTHSPPSEVKCPYCGTLKAGQETKTMQMNQPFGDLLADLGGIVKMTIGQMGGNKKQVRTTRIKGNKEEVVVYEVESDNKIRVLDQEALERRREMEHRSPKKTLIALDRNPFVMATGASETELLGDVRHDPYGGHEKLGTPPFERVIAGAIHEAHQGVLYLDELPTLGPLQRNILTAMQEKRYPIAGRNPQSAGASVKVEGVPCDLIFVGACNIQDLQHILSPLRSRIIGSGYEVLMETSMPDNRENRVKLIQFMAQEIAIDGRIPHLDQSAIKEVIREAGKRAQMIDGKEKALSLRLRELGGLIRSAGDIATMEDAPMITAKHIKEAALRNRTAEQQIKERYGSYQMGVARDVSSSQKDANNPYNYWDQHINDDKRGYE